MPEHGPHRPRNIRRARADDYAEPLRGMIERGETELPDEYVIEEWVPAHVLPPDFAKPPEDSDA